MSHHQVTDKDITKVSDLGFNIDFNGHGTAEDFINQFFKGFNILQFAQQIENTLQPIAEDAIHRSLELTDEIQPKIVIAFITYNLTDADHRLLFKRTFIKEADGLTVKHDFLSLPLAARGKRIGRKVLQFCNQHYQAIGVTKIKIHAALEDGGYEWTKAGFRATEPHEMEKILLHAEQALNLSQYRLVKKLYDDYYGRQPDGNAFPIIEWSGLPFMKAILRKNDWHGELDLTNPEDLFNFNEYVNG